MVPECYCESMTKVRRVSITSEVVFHRRQDPLAAKPLLDHAEPKVQNIPYAKTRP